MLFIYETPFQEFLIASAALRKITRTNGTAGAAPRAALACSVSCLHVPARCEIHTLEVLDRGLRSQLTMGSRIIRCGRAPSGSALDAIERSA